jgi:DNA-binding NtrC family response regulator/tetratricopeptide (TPR) repeat protein
MEGELARGARCLIVAHASACEPATFERILQFLILAPHTGMEAAVTGWPGKPLEGFRTLALPVLTVPHFLKTVHLPGLGPSQAIARLQALGRRRGLLPGELVSDLAPDPVQPPPPSPAARKGWALLAEAGVPLPAAALAPPMGEALEAEGWAFLREERWWPARPLPDAPPDPAVAREVLERGDPPGPVRRALEALLDPAAAAARERDALTVSAREGNVFGVLERLDRAEEPERCEALVAAWQGDAEKFSPLSAERPGDPDLALPAFLLRWEGMTGPDDRTPEAPDAAPLLEARRLRRDGRPAEARQVLEGAAGDLRSPWGALAALALADLRASEGDREEAMALLARCQEALPHLPPAVAGQYYRYLSYFFYTLGRLKDAAEAAHRWLAEAVSRGWLWQEALALNDLGVILNESDRPGEARMAFASAAALARHLGSERKLNLVYFNLGEIALQEGDLAEAERIFTAAAAADRERDDRHALFFDLVQLARVHYWLGSHREVRARLEEIEALGIPLSAHPWGVKVPILRTELAKWGDREDYRAALRDLKGWRADIPQDRADRERLLGQGALRKACPGPVPPLPLVTAEKGMDWTAWERLAAEPNPIPAAVLALEWDRFHPGKVPQARLRRALDLLKERGALGWEAVAQPRVDVGVVQAFEFLTREEFDPDAGPVPFAITLPSGKVYAAGTLTEKRALELPGGGVLTLSAPHYSLLPEEFWKVWGLTLQARLGEAPVRRPEVLTHSEPQVFHGFVYACPKSALVVYEAQKVARAAIPVHITGETGSGKEVLAQALHRASPRRGGPFVAVNCASIPESLFEGEIFGWRKGAFTGALMDRPGVIEAAHGGTLFLDEVGELPPALQAKLLRVLNDRRIQRLGDARSFEVDFRLVTATNRSLKDMVREGRFREDLFYRLAVATLDLPPLRERREDIPFIARALVEKNRHLFDLPPVDLHPLYLTYLMEQEWRGNVRELENFLLACLVHVQKGEPLSIRHAPAPTPAPGDELKIEGNYQALIREYRRKVIVQALERSGWDRPKAATLLGITPQALGYQMRELGIAKP